MGVTLLVENMRRLEKEVQELKELVQRQNVLLETLLEDELTEEEIKKVEKVLHRVKSGKEKLYTPEEVDKLLATT